MARGRSPHLLRRSLPLWRAPTLRPRPPGRGPRLPLPSPTGPGHRAPPPRAAPRLPHAWPPWALGWQSSRPQRMRRRRPARGRKAQVSSGGSRAVSRPPSHCAAAVPGLILILISPFTSPPRAQRPLSSPPFCRVCPPTSPAEPSRALSLLDAGDAEEEGNGDVPMGEEIAPGGEGEAGVGAGAGAADEAALDAARCRRCAR